MFTVGPYGTFLNNEIHIRFYRLNISQEGSEKNITVMGPPTGSEGRMGQNEYDGAKWSGDVVSAVTVKELMISRSSVLLFLFQLEKKLITMGSPIFGKQIKIPSVVFRLPVCTIWTCAVCHS